MSVLDVNDVKLAGNLTRDPELRFTNSGNPVCGFGLATNRTYRDGNGELQEDVTYIDVSVFGNQAESVANYKAKGDPIYLEGRLNYSSWETDEGQRRSKLDVIAAKVQFLPRPQPSGQNGQGSSQGGQAQQGASQQAGNQGPADSEDFDDIPF